MDSNDILTILEDVLQHKKCKNEDGEYIDEYVNYNPFSDKKDILRYTVDKKDNKIVVTNMQNDEKYPGSFRDLLWRKLHLDSVCATYQEQYDNWKKLNYDIPYVETNIISDSDEKPLSSYDFIHSIWKVNQDDNEQSGLKLLMAEYGMGKSSFCQGVKLLVSNEIKDDFLKNDASFPLVFDLNEYRDGSFDEFVKNRLSDHYGINIKFSTFVKLCQAGVFSVVLDAWDQMHATPVMSQTIKDISEFSVLWKGKGRVVVTCRRSFYQKQLHMKKGEMYDGIQKAKFYTLLGFDEESARDYFKEANKILEDNKKIDMMWADGCWRINSDLFSRPLNLKLLVKHFDTITEKYELANEKVETYQFLQTILLEWQNRVNYVLPDKGILKSLVMLTLNYGLNRGVSIDSFRQKIKSEITSDEHWDNIVGAIKELDFISIGYDGQIEFCLAAYQEFLWAYYVLAELEEGKLCDNDKLINRFMLTQEVRSWIARELKPIESDCLKQQLGLVKYKLKAEVGYSGSNAITLLRDLNSIEYYKQQLLELEKNLRFRPFDEADLRGLNLSNANFEGSSFIRADLSYTKLDNATFSGANLSEVTWNEYGKLHKCAFLNDSVIVGTESGRLLTFSVTKHTAQIQNLADETIRAVVADQEGVYTASRDGWISYIRDGQLRNVYIVGSGLQSIGTSGTKGSVYVGANGEGLYSYNWENGNYRRINVTEDGKPIERFDVSDIHYYKRENENNTSEKYIAYISENNKSLVLLKLENRENGTVVGKGELQREGLRFGDICFASDYLVYSIIGKGVYHIPFDEMYGKIKQDDLLSVNRCLYKCDNPVELAWVKDKQYLMVVEKSNDILRHVNCISLDENISASTKDLEWQLGDRIYNVNGDKVGGFCVSNDGKYIALTGETLEVLELIDDEYYQLIREPIEARISCNGAEFKGCTGLTENNIEFLKERGATIKT